jgi:hypothetical protein
MRFLCLFLRTSLGLISYCTVLDLYQFLFTVLEIRYLVVQYRGYPANIP